MNDYQWMTETCHASNNDTMTDYLDNHLPEGWSILIQDGTYAEATDEMGTLWGLHASGNGDSYNHLIRFEHL